MVVLRFKRYGRIHRPTYRLCAADKRCPRNGTVIEELGWFDPAGPEGKQFEFNMERVAHWFKMGAQPSPTAANMIKKAGGAIPAAAAKALAVRSKVSKHPKPVVENKPAEAAAENKEEAPKGE